MFALDTMVSSLDERFRIRDRLVRPLHVVRIIHGIKFHRQGATCLRDSSVCAKSIVHDGRIGIHLFVHKSLDCIMIDVCHSYHLEILWIAC